MKKNMFDLHYLTFWGIIIIAVGTILGTILIQRGNVLKSKEGSTETQRKLSVQTDEIKKLNEQNSEIKSLYENLKTITEQQNILLKNQGELLQKQLNLSDKQGDILKNNVFTDFSSNFNTYQELTQKYQQASHLLYQQQGKEVFLSLSTPEIDDILSNSRKAIENILANKFVTSNQDLFGLWKILDSEISFRLYTLRLQQGEYFKFNNVLYQMDNKLRSEKYDELQTYLIGNSEKIHHKTSEILDNFRQKND
jgi:hypothetical protein